MSKVNGHRPVNLFEGAGMNPVGPVPIEDGDVPFSLTPVLESVTALRTEIPKDAHTAPYLGTEREGSAVVIDDNGLVVTVGYLMLESRSVEIVNHEGDWVPAQFIAYDFETGFGLARATTPLDLPAIDLGDSDRLMPESTALIVASDGRESTALATIASRREFAGYWEYLLDEAIFTMPFFPNWSGAGLLGMNGLLVGIGSLLVDDALPDDPKSQGNMFIPTNRLRPILDELATDGRPSRRSRPWLGLFTSAAPGQLIVTQVAPDGPAEIAGIRPGDTILRIDGQGLTNLADLYRRMWEMGPAGTAIPLTILRETAGIEVVVRSIDRYDYFRTPRE